MTDNVHPFGARKHPVTLPENDLTRGIALMHKLLARVPQEPSLVSTDAEHIIHAMRRLGEISDAYMLAHVDIDGEVEDAIVALLRWRLDRERGYAA